MQFRSKHSCLHNLHLKVSPYLNYQTNNQTTKQTNKQTKRNKTYINKTHTLAICPFSPILSNYPKESFYPGLLRPHTHTHTQAHAHTHTHTLTHNRISPLINRR